MRWHFAVATYNPRAMAAEPSGGLSEASQLLHEGLQLLEERRREVDLLVDRAQERAQQITEEAARRAEEITTQAERQRTELEEQVAALRAEVADLRKQLASLQSANGGTQAAATAALAEHQHPDAAELVEASEVAGTPRWGRRSTIAGARQAIRTRTSRPRWLPPWLPFAIALLVIAAFVATNVDGQGGAARPTPLAAALEATSTPAQAVLQREAATATTEPTATTLVVFAPTVAPTPTPQVVQTSAPPTRETVAPVKLPPAGARVTTPVTLPGEPGPEGPIVAAFTTYTTYTVRPGDTLNRIATQFGVSGETIIRTSGVADPNLLFPGQVLTIPKDTGWLYRVQPGDTLEIIARRFGISVDDLMKSSNVGSGTVRPGELLFVSARGVTAPKQ